MATSFQRPRGTRDYLPEDMRIRRRVTEAFRRVFELYGYGEVLTPAFEHLELLEAKAGPEVREQIYWFVDKGGRKLGLRFELTTPIARVVASRPELPKPVRLYYIAPVWRYEEPQRGRLREFWHAGVELIGSRYVDADAEVVAVMYRALREAGLRSVVIRLSDRGIAEGLADRVGVEPSRRDDFFRAIDKLSKVGEEGVLELLARLGLTREQSELVLTFVTMGGSNEERLDEASRELRSEAALAAVERVRELIELLVDGYGVPEESLEVDFSIVRGLAYYTSLVYEAVVPERADVGSVAGGGRYDNLVRLVGGPELPATGMAIGVERVVETLSEPGEARGDWRRVVIVAPASRELYRDAVRVAELLRSSGVSAQCDVMHRRLRAIMEHADRLRATYVVIVGARELSAGAVTVKDMRSGEQRVVKISELASHLKRALAGS